MNLPSPLSNLLLDRPSTHAPILPSHLNDLELASNASHRRVQAPMIFYDPSKKRSDCKPSLGTEGRQENELPLVGLLEAQNRLHQSGAGKTMRSLKTGRLFKRNRLPATHQRIFHWGAYEASTFSISPDLGRESVYPSSSSIYFKYLAQLAYYPKVYDSQAFWLTLYFCFNLGLTLFNKGVLVRFPFPYTLTALHALCGSIGGYSLVRSGVYTPVRPTTRETTVLVAFSVLYAFNIVVSNTSLQLVTVPVVRAVTPIFTIVFSALLLGRYSSRTKLVSLIPVIAGVGLATYGDYYFTRWGFLLTLLGTVLAALKTIFTNILQCPPPPALCLSTAIQSKLPVNFRFSQHPPTPILLSSLPRLLHPLDLLILMSPLAFIQCVIFAYLSGELDHVRQYSLHEMTIVKAFALLANGCIAFGLNFVSFTANKKVGALSMTVAANVKQALTIFFAVVVFDLSVTAVNVLGILLTLVGGAWYAGIEYQDKKRMHSSV